MAVLTWDQTGERLYETGVDRGVVYPMVSGAYPSGEAWNGLTNVTEKPSGAEPTAFYADNKKYLNILSAEDYASSVEAYTYPDAFAACNGEKVLAQGMKVSQQTRQPFGFTYRSKIGNDTDGDEHGYKLHIVYNCLAAPTEKAHNTINESPEPETMSWELSTSPADIPGVGFKPSAHIEIDSTKVVASELKALEDILYGTANADARLPLPAELVTIIHTGYIPPT